jgi:hypothetical protein
MTVAALYVEKDGVYYGLPDVDPWPIDRDARTYPGPHAVVAHPECARWCQMAPVNQARYGQAIGADEGVFDAALTSVRTFGGVLEHPAMSLAWKAFRLPRPNPHGGWTLASGAGAMRAWVAEVAQRNYGHRATKKTWLYVVLPVDVLPPDLAWGKGPPPEAWISADRPRAELAARGIAQLSKREAKATPPAFRDLLLSIARSATRALPEGTP